MVDTLHFRIHDLQIHEHLKNYLLKLYKTGRTKKRIEVDEETGEIAFKNKFVFENLAFLDTGNNYVVNHFNQLKSSHYNIAYKIDISRDFIEVNVSLPKYYYGTNVIQMLPHLYDKEYTPFFHASSFKETIENFYRIFLKVFMNFLEKNFPNTHLSFVELVRIDFCFNQVFNTKSEALEYFQLLKSRRKKYERENPHKFYYDTSFSNVSRDHSFKVYHQGTEFNKNDRKELFKINEKAGREKYNLKKLQHLADLTLRYELTCRNRFLYRSYIFACELKSSTYKKAYSNWNKYKKHPDKISKIKNLVERTAIKKDVKEIDKLINQSRRFYFGNCPGDIKLTADIFKVFLNKFYDMVSDIQVRNDSSKLLDISKVMNEIDSFEGIKKLLSRSSMTKGKYAVNRSKIRMILAMMEGGLTLDEIRKGGLIPKATFYRYANFLKSLGVDNHSVYGIHVDQTLCFQNYYLYLNKNANEIKNIRMLPI